MYFHDTGCVGPYASYAPRMSTPPAAAAAAAAAAVAVTQRVATFLTT